MTKLNTLKEIEQRLIKERLSRFNGDRDMVADSLGISVVTLQSKMKKMGLTRTYRVSQGADPVAEWTEAVRALNVTTTTEWRDKDRSSYVYMSKLGLMTKIAKELGLTRLMKGRPKKWKEVNTTNTNLNYEEI